MQRAANPKFPFSCFVLTLTVVNLYFPHCNFLNQLQTAMLYLKKINPNTSEFSKFRILSFSLTETTQL